jgi:hypothetical protein
MAGILGKSEAAKAALLAPPHRRALYRLPWLLVGMAGSALATAMMTRFEAALAAHWWRSSSRRSCTWRMRSARSRKRSRFAAYH